jgi:hypothetical protein
MFRRKSNLWLAILISAVGLSLACDGGQLDEANKLVNEANAVITKNNELVPKVNALTNELFGEGMTKAEDLDKYKADNKAKFDELIKMNEDLAKGREESAAKFEQVSKMKVDDKFKEYTSLKSQELKKGAEIDKAEVAFVKAFLAESDAEKANELVADTNKKSAEMKKVADELRDKAEKIVKDNPTIFK